MSKIDELPLDMFGEEVAEPSIATATVSTNPPSELDTNATDWSKPDATTSMRSYDVVAVLAIAAASGLGLRLVGAGFTMPAFNIGLALVIYMRGSRHRRNWYYDRAIKIREGVEAELAAAEGVPVPDQVTTYRIVYDIGAVVVAALAIRVIGWMTGIDRIPPDQFVWTLSFATAIAAYLFATSKVNRSTLHTWMYQRAMDLKA